jgi:hypothetical protein
MRSRVPVAVASAVGGRCTIVIRFAQPTDGPGLARLEGLSGRSLGSAPILVAEADGELVAAAPAAGGDAVSDPFRVTLDITELLRLRSSQLRAAA